MLALDGFHPQVPEVIAPSCRLLHGLADQDLTPSRPAHQPGGQGDLDADGPVRASRGAAISAGPHLAPSQAYPGVADEAQLRRRLGEVHGRRCRPRGVVLVSGRGAKDGVEEIALVAKGQLDQVALIASQHALHPADVVVEFAPCLIVAVIVDAVEMEHQGHRGPHLG